MKLRSAMLSAVCLLGLCLTELEAQEAFPAAGGNAAGIGGTVSYTVGQIVYTTNVGASATIAQGVQQPYEISVITGIEQANGLQLSFKAFPNPTTDLLTLGIEGLTTLNIEAMSYQLYDNNGKLLEYGKLKGSLTSIDMSPYVPAIYLLNVSQKTPFLTQSIKTFKIIKR